MYELLYCSSAKPDLTTDDIADILQASLRWNLQNGITGCLLYFDKKFIQFIEGDKELIKKLFSAIEKDTRHENVIVLAENEKKDRYFTHWTLAYKELSLSDMENIEKVLMVSNFIAINALDCRMSSAVKLFCTIAKEPFLKLTLPPQYC